MIIRLYINNMHLTAHVSLAIHFEDNSWRLSGGATWNTGSAKGR